MSKFTIGFVLLLAGCNQSADAQSQGQATQEVDKFSAIYDNCIDKNQVDTPTGLDNSLIARCSGEESDAAKEELNIIYKRLYDSLISNDQQYAADELEKAQKSWIVFRDNSCDLEGSLVGPPAVGMCHATMIKERVKELYGYLPPE